MIGMSVRWSTKWQQRPHRCGSGSKSERARLKRRIVVERLEDRVVLSGLLNGNFSINDPSNPNYGWTTQGSASIANGEGILNEGTTVETQFSQSFTIAPGTTTLQFSIVTSDLVTNGPRNPPDAFEAALLDSTTDQPLIGPVTGLTNTDAFLNIQQTGQVYYAPQVTVPGAGASGSVSSLAFPEEISVDVSSVPANTQATLYFDLIGFAPATSSVRITAVTVNQGAAPPPVSFTLDPATNSGPVGENITNFDPVNLIGVTDPDVTVALETTGNGFINGTTTSDANGHFTFTGLELAQGANTVSVQATNAQGSSVATQTITIDQEAPVGVLESPAPNSTITQDPGYVDVQWTDAGAAPIDASTFGAGNITVTGVTINSVQDLGNDLERYSYSQTGATLPTGPITVTEVAGQVADLAGNTNASGSQSFTFQPLVVLAPLANNQSVLVPENTVTGITLTGSDPNVPPLPLGFAVSTQPAHGSLSGTAPNLFYMPDVGYFGPDSFQFTDSNGVQTSNAATVSISVVGQPTVTGPLALTVPENHSSTFTLMGTDPNSPALPLTFTVIAQPLHGTLSGTAPLLTYSPDTGYFGDDDFEFTAGNSTATSAPETVAITIIGQPSAESQSVTTIENTGKAIVLEGSDPNSPPEALSYTVTVRPAHGTLSGTAPNLVYTPDNGYSGSDSFQFTDTNTALTSSTATVSITVTPVTTSQQPVAVNDYYTTTVNQPLNVGAPGVLTNDLPRGASLTASLMAGPQHGALSFYSNGSFVYTPSLNYVGSDSFTYQAQLGTTLSNVATVFITIKSSVQSTGPLKLLPDTPYYNYVRQRWSRDPARFDYWHPQIGAILGLEVTGIPTTPRKIVLPSIRLNVNADREEYNENPTLFDEQQPILGALFRLETPPVGTDLLPNTAYYQEQRALYESDSTKYQLKNVYLGAIFAIEDYEQVNTPMANAARPATISVKTTGAHAAVQTVPSRISKLRSR
jgi:hypothetical protein